MALKHRLWDILCGYVSANLAAGTIVAAFELQGWRIDAGLLMLAAYGFMITSFGLLFPALVVIAFAEVLRIRSVWVYAFLAALYLILYACFVNLIQLTPAEHFRDGVVGAVMIIAGVVAGALYWSIAGRYAGIWRNPSPSVENAIA